MKNRFLAILIALSMLLSTEGFVFAAASESVSEVNSEDAVAVASEPTVVKSGVYGDSIEYEIWVNEETGANEAVLIDVIEDEEYGRNYITNVVIPDTIGGYPVTTIGYSAFSGCENLTSLKFGKNVRTLYATAFAGCVSLNNVVLPKNIDVVKYDFANPAFTGPFAGCESLTNVTIPDGTEFIAPGLFSECWNLSHIDIPSTVTEIRYSAFEYCESLRTIELSNGIKHIGNRAFNQCSLLNDIELSEELEWMGCGAFAGCESLEAINIPADLTLEEFVGSNYMYPGPFSGCDSLSEITFGEGTTKIPAALFQSCGGLRNLELPEGLIEIDWNAFQYCSNLESIEFNDELTTIRSSAFDGCTMLTDVKLPDSLKILQSGAFKDCTNLFSVYIPDKLETDDYSGMDSYPGAFAGCENLTVIKFAEGITSIIDALLWWGTGVERVTVPKTVAYVGYCTFMSDTLEEIVFEGPAPGHMDSLYNDPGLTVYVYPEHWRSFKEWRTRYDEVTWKKIGGTETDVSETDFEVELNYSGYVLTYAPLIGPNGNLMADTKVKYLCHEQGKEPSTKVLEATSDEKGYIQFKTPKMTRKSDPGIITDVRRFQFVPAEGEELNFDPINLTVDIAHLNFSESVKGMVGADAYAICGPGVGVSAGVVNADASLFEGKVGGGKAIAVGMDLEHTGAVTGFEITTTMDAKLAGKLKAGLEVGTLGSEVELATAEGGLEGGATVSNSLEIENINKLTAEDKENLGKYLLFNALVGSNCNATVMRLIEQMGLASVGSYSSGIKAVLDANVGIASLKIPVKGTPKKMQLFGVGTDFSLSANETINTNENLKQLSSEFSFGGSVNLPIDFLSLNGSASGSNSIAYREQNGEKFIIYDVTTGAGGELGDSSDDTEGSVGIEKVKKTKFTLNEKQIEMLKNDPEVKNSINNLINYRIPVINPKDYFDMVNSMNYIQSEIPTEESTEKSYKFSLELPFKLKALVGAEVGFDIKGAYTQEYLTGTGVFASEDALRYETVVDLEDAVGDENLIENTVTEAVDNIMKDVKALFSKVVEPIKTGVSYAGAQIKGAAKSTKNWFVSVTGINKRNVKKVSYAIPTYKSERAANKAVRSLSTDQPFTAATVAEPYVVAVEDENGNVIEDFSAEPLTLELSYTAEDLEIAGADVSDADDIAIYYYNENYDAYIFVGGTVDKTTSTVSVEITESGQYTLAIDKVAPEITDIKTLNVSAKPKFEANVSDFSGIKDFTFAIDGESLVTENNFKDYYNQVTGVFSYECIKKLGIGEHTAVLMAVDSRGFESTETWVFKVDAAAPEVKVVKAEIERRNVQLEVKIQDETETDVYVNLVYVKDNKENKKQITLEESSGGFVLEYIIPRSAKLKSVTIVAKDEGNNKTEKTVYKKTDDQVKYDLPAVYVGDEHMAYINSNKELYMWGRNSYNRINSSDEDMIKKPVLVKKDVINADVNFDMTAAITSDGTLYTWGYSEAGLGVEGIYESGEPVKVMENVKDVEIDYNCIALITTDGDLYTWGDNYYGQMGAGEEVDYSQIPIKIMEDVASVTLGTDHTLALKTDGTLYSWGKNSLGQLGDWTTELAYTPQDIMDNVESIDAWGDTSAAVDKKGNLYMWGENCNGQLGNDSIEDSKSPVKILENVRCAGLGYTYAAAVTEDGELYTWGNNRKGALGMDVGDENILKPTKVKDDVDWVTANDDNTVIKDSDGTIWIAGDNVYCQLADGSEDNWSETFKPLDIKGEPSMPSEPNEPINPETPTEPDEPINPETPTEPDEPINPETPTEPDEPTKPDEPEYPDYSEDEEDYEHECFFQEFDLKKATFNAAGKEVTICDECGKKKSRTIARVTTVKLSSSRYTYDGKKKTPVVTVKDSNGKSLKKGTDFTVTYGSGRIKTGVYTVTVKLKGKYYGTKKVNFIIQPKAPKAVKATLYGKYNSVKVSWSKVTGASGYKIYYKKSTAKKYNSNPVYTTKSSYIKKNLKAGTSYTFKVVPCFAKGKQSSQKYKTVQIKIMGKMKAPKVVKSGSMVKVSWKKMKGVSGYQISQAKKINGTKTFLPTTALSKKVKAAKNKTYYYKVRPYKKVNGKKIYGPWSNVKKFKR